jgi:hypothetical protein
MTKLTSALKISYKREMNNTTPLYAAGKGISTARSGTNVEVGDTASLTAFDKVLSLNIKIPKQEPEVIDEVNSGVFGAENHSKAVVPQECTIETLLSTANLWTLATTQVANSPIANSINTAIGVVNSFMFHLEDFAQLDFFGCYLTQYVIKITRDRPITQSITFKSRKGDPSVIVTNHPAATGTKMIRSNLTELTIDSVLLAALEITEATIEINYEWNEPEILNDDFTYEPSLKNVKPKVIVDYLAPNNSTYTSNWEYLLSINTIKLATIEFTIGSLIVNQQLTNMVLKVCDSRDISEKGLQKMHAEFEGGATTQFATGT